MAGLNAGTPAPTVFGALALHPLASPCAGHHPQNKPSPQSFQLSAPFVCLLQSATWRTISAIRTSSIIFHRQGL